jgi:teichoic acid transport system ATP-binding protein
MATEELALDTGAPGSGPLAVSVRNLSVNFTVYAERSLTLRQVVSRGFRGRESTTVEAVKDVSFDIAVGEAVGIVGYNGSGKSTLLAAIAGLLPPARGEVKVRTQPSLLSVGSALNPELSGYRNIVIGGLAMGLNMGEIKAMQDEVAEFTELGDALARPMKTYSSGMKARLAFAIATLQEPDILLIDEALAVGDKRFKQKSLARVRDIQERAGTIIMVTHSLDEVRTTCSRAMWMHEGEVRLDGSVEYVLGHYADT